MKNKVIKLLTMISVAGVLFTVMFLTAAGSFAHDEDVDTQENVGNSPINQDALKSLNIRIVAISGGLLLLLILLALRMNGNAGDRAKKIIFWSMVGVIVFPTFFFVGTTLSINFSSVTKGPVHWHADFKIIACGQEMKPPHAKGVLSNKTGTNVLHGHEDQRVHIEGVVTNTSDVSLEKFFEVQGGKLAEMSFAVPTSEGILFYENGDTCENGTVGVWQVFLYTTNNGVARQQKLKDFLHYVPSPYINVPPGDCIIFEFGPEKEKTEVLCDFYQLEIKKGNLKIL